MSSLLPDGKCVLFPPPFLPLSSAASGMHESSSSKSLLWVLPLLAAGLYLLCLPWVELRGSDETVFAAIAREMIESGDYLHPSFQGQSVQVFPLYPWLVCLFSGFQTPGVWAVRLPSVLAVFGMAAQAFLLARRHRDTHAGLLAAAIVLSTLGAFRVGILGQAETLHAFLLSGAWFAWHTLGVLDRRWRLAWGVALGLVTLDVLCTGLRGVFLFYLPLLFTTKPPRTRRLLRSREHLECLAGCALALYLWVTLVCPQPLTGWYAMVGPLSTSAAPEGFFAHLFHFPFRCLRDLLPWAFLVWVPFCLALRPLEPAGSLCGFLRATILTLFLCHWILPGYSSLMMLPVLPALAVTMSFNLPIVMHRQERGWGRVNRVLTTVTLLALLYGMLHWLWVALGRITFLGASEEWAQVLPALGIGIVFLLAFLAAWVWCLGRAPRAEGLLWNVLGLRVAWCALMLLPAFLTHGNREAAAMGLLGENSAPVMQEGPKVECDAELPKDAVVYLLSEKHSFPAQMHYLGHRVERLRKGDPLGAGPIYVVAESQPLFPGWDWKKLSGPVDFQLHRKLVPSPLVPDWRMLTWSYPGRQYHREDVYPETVSPYVRKYFEPVRMNLYRGEKLPLGW